jgi:hypothetical protein
MRKIISFLTIVIFYSFSAQTAQLKRVAAIGFYNVENLWDTIRSADYIDGTLPKSHRNFHRSIPLDSLKYLDFDDAYKGKWSDDFLIGKKVVRYQAASEEFTPKSSKNYTHNIYQQKLLNAAKVISELGSKYTKSAPVVVGLAEVENRQVVEDLVKQPPLEKFDFGVVHYNSYDPRGIDVALIYQKKRFTVTHSEKRNWLFLMKRAKESIQEIFW